MFPGKEQGRSSKAPECALELTQDGRFTILNFRRNEVFLPVGEQGEQ
jgi:hypothetical protein